MKQDRCEDERKNRNPGKGAGTVLSAHTSRTCTNAVPCRGHARPHTSPGRMLRSRFPSVPAFGGPKDRGTGRRWAGKDGTACPPGKNTGADAAWPRPGAPGVRPQTSPVRLGYQIKHPEIAPPAGPTTPLAGTRSGIGRRQASQPTGSPVFGGVANAPSFTDLSRPDRVVDQGQGATVRSAGADFRAPCARLM